MGGPSRPKGPCGARYRCSLLFIIMLPFGWPMPWRMRQEFCHLVLRTSIHVLHIEHVGGSCHVQML